MLLCHRWPPWLQQIDSWWGHGTQDGKSNICAATGSLQQGLVNVPMFHISQLLGLFHLQQIFVLVMFKIPKKGHLPTPGPMTSISVPHRCDLSARVLGPIQNTAGASVAHGERSRCLCQKHVTAWIMASCQYDEDISRKSWDLNPPWQICERPPYHTQLNLLQISHFIMWGFPRMVVPPNGWLLTGNPIKMADLGVPLFQETS